VLGEVKEMSAMTTDKIRAMLAEIRERADSLKDVHPDAPRSLPEFAWPGGYPLYYVTKQGNVLCADCATEEADQPPGDYPQYDDSVVDYDVHWEGPSLYCEGCNKEIESAYGEPDEAKE
jgi:hypothetical protein